MFGSQTKKMFAHPTKSARRAGADAVFLFLAFNKLPFFINSHKICYVNLIQDIHRICQLFSLSSGKFNIPYGAHF